MKKFDPERNAERAALFNRLRNLTDEDLARARERGSMPANICKGGVSCLCRFGPFLSPKPITMQERVVTYWDIRATGPTAVSNTAEARARHEEMFKGFTYQPNYAY